MVIVRPDAQPQELPTFDIWPENLPAWEFFMGCTTQWRHGFEGPTGMDWPAVQLRMERLVPRRRRRRLWDLVEAMERGALRGWRETRERQERRRGG